MATSTFASVLFGYAPIAEFLPPSHDAHSAQHDCHGLLALARMLMPVARIMRSRQVSLLATERCTAKCGCLFKSQHKSCERLSMRTNSIHSFIDQAAKGSKDVASKVVEKTHEALEQTSRASKVAAADIITTVKKGEHRVQETTERLAHDAEDIAVKAAHAAESAVQTVSHRVKETATEAQHRARELADKAARKLKPR